VSSFVQGKEALHFIIHRKQIRTIQNYRIGHRSRYKLGLEAGTATTSSTTTKMSTIACSTLQPWTDSKSLKKCFDSLFSFSEMIQSKILGGLPMGVDPEREARETLLSLANMVDRNVQRAFIQPKDQSEGICVDIVTYKGKKVWSEKEEKESEKKKPLIFLHYFYNSSANQSKQEMEFIFRTMPQEGVQQVWCGTKEELYILRKLLDENASRIAPPLRAEIKKELPSSWQSLSCGHISFITPSMSSKKKPVCELCGTETKLSCSRCKVVYYCSRQCQTKHWRGGHKLDCKSPEDVAKEMSKCSIDDGSQNLWVDIDPKKTVTEDGDINFLMPRTQPTGEFLDKPSKLFFNVKTSLENRPGPSMMKIKVQFLGQPEAANYPLLIYNEGRDFVVSATCENIHNGGIGYGQLRRLILSEGYQSYKVYLDAYVKEDGSLRVLLNNVIPLLPW